jgi:DNA repair protein RadC
MTEKSGKMFYGRAGHRQRLREHYLKEGLDSFSDAQILELLLFYAIPYRDTKPLAYMLLNEFGSLSQVLEAEPHELAKVPGIGENSALFLSLLPDICQKYQQDKWGKKPLLNTAAALGEYAVSLFTGCSSEVFYLLCLDIGGNLNQAALLHKGTIDEVSVYPRVVVETALKHKAKKVAFAHNHPGGTIKPTADDMELTWALIDAMERIDIPVIDHIIVSGLRYFSFHEKGLLPSVGFN